MSIIKNEKVQEISRLLIMIFVEKDILHFRG